MNDPNIIFQAMRTTTPFDPIGSYQAGQQSRAMEQQRLLNQAILQDRELKVQQERMAQERAMGIGKIVSQFGTPDGGIDVPRASYALSQAGYGPEAQKLYTDWQKSQAEIDYKRAQTGKETAETKVKGLDVASKSRDYWSQSAGATSDVLDKYGAEEASATWNNFVANAGRMGLSTEGVPQTFDPKFILGTARAGLTEKDRSDVEVRTKEQAAVEDRFNRGLAVTLRGQNLTNARADEANRIAAKGNLIKGETDLRKEFEGLSEVKNYKLAYPSFAAIKSASQRDTPQSDINLIYGIAKLYDPTSVVREGEYATIANSQSIPEKIKGMAKQLAGGGKLTQETKKQLMTEAENRLKVFEDEYLKAQGTFGGIAQDRGLNPKAVFSPIGRISSAGKRIVSKSELEEAKKGGKAIGKSGAQIEADIKARGWEIE